MTLTLLKGFFKNEAGNALLEYGLITGLIAVVCASTIKNIGTTANTRFTTIQTTM